MAREREGCYETTTKLAWSDRHDDVTAMLTGSEYEQEVHDEAVETSVVISRDLRHAIDLLRAVPSACITSRRRSRLPLRPVNRLSLPPQLPHHRDVVPEDLAVRQCSSMTDDVMYTTGALYANKLHCEKVHYNPSKGRAANWLHFAIEV